MPSARAAALSGLDRKSTRLNSSHANISYAVFCLKKKKNQGNANTPYRIMQNNLQCRLHALDSGCRLQGLKCNCVMNVDLRYPTLFLFFFNDTATTEIYTLSLHVALPIATTGTSSSRARIFKPRLIWPTCSTRLARRSEEHTSELQSRQYLVCRLLLEKKKTKIYYPLLLKKKKKTKTP